MSTTDLRNDRSRTTVLVLNTRDGRKKQRSTEVQRIGISIGVTRSSPLCIDEGCGVTLKGVLRENHTVLIGLLHVFCSPGISSVGSGEFPQDGSSRLSVYCVYVGQLGSVLVFLVG